MASKRLSKKERDELEALMEVRDPRFAGPMQGSITRVHGFLTSVISGPMVMPSEWLPVVFGNEDDDAAWDTIEQAQRAMSLLMRLHNEVAAELADTRGFSILIDRLGDPPDELDLADDWCRGYVLGFALREDAWKEAMDAPELRTAFLPILSLAGRHKAPDIDPLDNPENYAAIVDMLPASALEICAWWREKLSASPARHEEVVYSGTVRRAAPKISPNAPCPCGSGKKYKRCCSPLRAV